MKPIIFKTRDELVKVEPDKMVYAEADGNYVYINMRNGQRLMITITLQNFEQLVANAAGKNAGRFIRIGRRYIVDKRYITAISTLKQQLLLTDSDTIKPIILNVPKEALKTLKQKLTEDDLWK